MANLLKLSDEDLINAAEATATQYNPYSEFALEMTRRSLRQYQEDTRRFSDALTKAAIASASAAVVGAVVAVIGLLT